MYFLIRFLSIVRSRNKFDGPAYYELADHICFPGLLDVDQLLKSSAREGTLRVENEIRYGKVILTRTDTIKSSASRKKLSSIGEECASPTEKVVYIHKKTKASQEGEPLDKKFRDVYLVDMARIDDGVREGKRAQDIFRSLTPVSKSILKSGPVFDHNKRQFSDIVHIFSDTHGGLLFYCPLRNAFFCTEHADPSIGYYEISHGDNDTGRVTRYKHKKTTSTAEKHYEHVSIWTKFSLAPIEIEKPEEIINNEPTVIEEKISEEDEYFQNLERVLRETITAQANSLVNSASETALERVSGSPVRHHDDHQDDAFLDCIGDDTLGQSALVAVGDPDKSDKKDMQKVSSAEKKMSFFHYPLKTKEKALGMEQTSLTFESYIRDIEDEEYPIYDPLLVAVYRKPRDMVSLLMLSKYLLSVGCSKESFLVLVRAIECSEYPENVILDHEISLLQILATKMVIIHRFSTQGT